MPLLVVDFHHYQNPSKVLRDRVRLRGDGKYGGRNSRWHRKSPNVDLLHDGDDDRKVEMVMMDTIIRKILLIKSYQVCTSMKPFMIGVHSDGVRRHRLYRH